jgi:hypothetical protein
MVTAVPTLKNPRHERFAQLLASGKTATNALSWLEPISKLFPGVDQL